MSKEKKLDELSESFESDVVNREEYEEQRKKIEEEPEEEKKQGNEEENILKETEENNKEEKAPEEEKKSKKSDKILIYFILGLVLIFVVLFSVRLINPAEQPATLEELHLFNLKGKLKPEQGYVYNDVYSFVKFDDLWYMQLQSSRGTRLYNMALRYGPKDVEDMRINGNLDTLLFDNATDYYVTFNPVGSNFSHVALAVGDFNQHMTNVFFKVPIAACDKNETLACSARPVITCDNTDKIVLYVKEANNTNVYYDDNCIVVEGYGFDLVKGVDRVLYNLYGIMEQ